jgi:hypothetical protein
MNTGMSSSFHRYPPNTDSIPSVLSSTPTANFSSGAMGEYFLFPSIACGVIRKNAY